MKNHVPLLRWVSLLLLLVCLSAPALALDPRGKVDVLHTATATATADGLAVQVFDYGSVGVQNTITAAWDGTLTYEATLDTTTWVALTCYNPTTTVLSTTTVAAASYVICPVTGAERFRARVSGRTVGTVTVTASRLALPSTSIGASGGAGGVAANINVQQINGVAPLMGSGVTGTGSPRVSLATDVPLPVGANNVGNVDIERMASSATVDTESTGITSDTTLEAATANLRLIGWTTRESAAGAAVATVLVRHGVVAAGNCTGNVIAYIELGPDQAANMSYSSRGLAVASGVCADVLAGTVDVNIFTVTEAAP